MTEDQAMLLIVGTPKWIDVRQLAPEIGQEVCYYSPRSGAWTGRYNGPGKLGHKFSSFYDLDDGSVTHWFPLPDRPDSMKKKLRTPLNGRVRACK